MSKSIGNLLKAAERVAGEYGVQNWTHLRKARSAERRRGRFCMGKVRQRIKQRSVPVRQDRDEPSYCAAPTLARQGLSAARVR
jgi:hypothetical protein